MTHTERRAAPRISVSLPVQLQTERGDILHGTIENLSESGMLLVAHEELTIGSEVRVLFGYGKEDRTIEIQGRIVRSTPVGGFGVAFVTLGEQALAAIRSAMHAEG